MDKRLKNIAVKLSNKVKERISVIDDLQDEAVYELIEEERFKLFTCAYRCAFGGACVFSGKIRYGYITEVCG